METMKISLVDNDYVTQARTTISMNSKNEPLKKIFHEIKEVLIPGQTAFLEIEGLERDSATYVISVVE